MALHLAAQALRSGECDLALAGGVTAAGRAGRPGVRACAPRRARWPWR
ncbi:beta-ketoacyl synthase N-terminal-like domain-containing protein [Streptomyces sp. NPDC001130]